MLPFSDMGVKFDVSNTGEYLAACNYWGEHPQRGAKGTPHQEMADIWVRFLNPKQSVKSGDMSPFQKEHESEWLKYIPGVGEMCKALMTLTEGDRLGGVLITKLPPGGKIHPHIDAGWHASYYDKYYIPISNKKGARFCFEDGVIEPEEGQVFGFRNDVLHWVENDSNEDRIAMIVCIHQNKFEKGGSLCLLQQQQQQQR